MQGGIKQRLNIPNTPVVLLSHKCLPDVHCYGQGHLAVIYVEMEVKKEKRFMGIRCVINRVFFPCMQRCKHFHFHDFV